MKCHDGVPEPASEGVGPLSLGGAASMLMGGWAWMGWPASPPPGAGAQYSAYAGSPLIPSPSPSAISGVAGKISLTTSLEIWGSRKTDSSLERTCETPPVHPPPLLVSSELLFLWRE